MAFKELQTKMRLLRNLWSQFTLSLMDCGSTSLDSPQLQCLLQGRRERGLEGVSKRVDELERWTASYLHCLVSFTVFFLLLIPSSCYLSTALVHI